jgi:hypothetical protein
MAIGRISGQMLKANLLRSGTDLAFETNLLVLDVSNSFVGIGTATPSRQLHISGTGALRLPSGSDAQRGTSANGDIRYNSDQNYIEGYSNGEWKNLADQGIENVVEDTTPQLGGNLDVQTFSIETSVTNGNVTISPNGTGSVVMSKVDIGGGEIDGTTIGANSAAAGTFTNLTANGTINIDGDGSGDNIDGVIIGANLAAAGTFTTVTTSSNVIVGGNLTVNGTTTTIDSETLTVEDPFLTLAKNNSGGDANTFDQGLLFNRGSLDNVAFFWDESADEFVVAVTAGETGSTAGNVTITSYAQARIGIVKADTSLDTGAIKALDGTAAATIANSTGIITIPSSVLTTTDINGGTIDGTAIGGNARSTGQFTSIDANAGIDIDADNQSLTVGAGADFTIAHDGTDTTLDNNTGILKILGASGSSIQINSDAANVDTRISGDAVANLFYVDASADKIGIKTSAPAYTLDIASATDAVALPVGDDSQRPTASVGVIRFNQQQSAYEGSTDGSTWVKFQMSGEAPIISKVSATGDGSTSTFTGFFASAPASVANVLVFIDNVYQEPTENYTISSTNITFSEAPHSGARIFAIVGFDNTAAGSGGIQRTETTSISFTSAATTIASFNATSYRSAEMFITTTDSANAEYEVAKALVVHDGSTAYVTVYGQLSSTGSDLSTYSATLTGGSVLLQAVSSGGTQTAKVQYSLSAV